MMRQLTIKTTSQNTLDDVFAQASTCQKCSLCRTRSTVVFADGNPQAKLMIIGEAPSQQDDIEGRPFSGRAGKLLDRILASANIDRRSETYICNIVKCRTSDSRIPSTAEIAACAPYLEAQLELVRPRLILLTGATAVANILKVKDPISRIRGKWFEYKNNARVMPVFNPSYLLRSDSREPGSPKWLMWQDIQEVRRALDSLAEESMRD